jgi:hypothetical protein
VNRDYDLFEHFPDDSLVWHGQVTGLKNVSHKLEEIAGRTLNECFAIHLPTHEVVARLNHGASPKETRKSVIFQIAYDQSLALARARLLRSYGYEVRTVMGNEAAKVVLTLPQYCDLFIVGYHAALESRRQMVAWLKTKYGGVPVLALSAPETLDLTGADYNASMDSCETWLSKVFTALR